MINVLGRPTGVVGAVGSTVVSASGSGTAPITYDPAGRRTDIVREDGTKWHYDYNTRNEVTGGRKSFSDNTAVPGHQFTYGYDGIGNRLTASTGGNPNGAGLEELSYTPNALNQYSAFTNPGSQWITGEAASGANVVVNDAFTWRHGGFFARKLDLGNASGPAGTEVTIKANMPPGGGTMVSASRTGRLLTGPANVSPQYDDDGNLLTDGLWTCTWDGENRLKSAETASSLPATDKRKLEYAYDFEGRLVKITKYAHTGTDWAQESSTLLLYDGWNILAEINGTGVKKFLWGPDLSGTLEGAGGIGGLLAMTDSGSGKTALAVGDVNGNVSTLVDATTGEVGARYGYGPFGEPLQAAGPLAKANPFRWSSKYSDNETGLLYYGYRFYSPEEGRWISKDPIGEMGGVNLYGVLGNDPTNTWDYLGSLGIPASKGPLQNGRDDFIYHYFHGHGTDFNLVAHGYEHTLESAISSKVEDTIKPKLLEIINDESRKRNDFYGGFELKITRISERARIKTYPDLTQAIFSVGHTTLITNLDGTLIVKCKKYLHEGRPYKFKGTRFQSIDDAFTDPFGIDQATGGWWPGSGDIPIFAQKYRINGTWQQPYETQGMSY